MSHEMTQEQLARQLAEGTQQIAQLAKSIAADRTMKALTPEQLKKQLNDKVASCRIY